MLIPYLRTLNFRRFSFRRYSRYTFRRYSLDVIGATVFHCLVAGGHQLRLFHQAPDALRPLNTYTLAERHRFIPCATLLVRLVKAPINHDGKPMQVRKAQKSRIAQKIGHWWDSNSVLLLRKPALWPLG